MVVDVSAQEVTWLKGWLSGQLGCQPEDIQAQVQTSPLHLHDWSIQKYAGQNTALGAYVQLSVALADIHPTIGRYGAWVEHNLGMNFVHLSHLDIRTASERKFTFKREVRTPPLLASTLHIPNTRHAMQCILEMREYTHKFSQRLQDNTTGSTDMTSYNLTLAYELAAWSDFDAAMHALASVLGIVPFDDTFNEHKALYWTDNAIGIMLHQWLDGLVNLGLLESRDEPDIQYRWRAKIPQIKEEQ